MHAWKELGVMPKHDWRYAKVDYAASQFIAADRAWYLFLHRIMCGSISFRRRRRLSMLNIYPACPSSTIGTIMRRTKRKEKHFFCILMDIFRSLL